MSRLINKQDTEALAVHGKIHLNLSKINPIIVYSNKKKELPNHNDLVFGLTTIHTKYPYLYVYQDVAGYSRLLNYFL